MLTAEDIQKQYSGLSPEKRGDFKRRVIYNIVNASYGDRITDFTIDPKPQQNAIVSGNFATPRLGGKNLIVDYLVNDDGVTLIPRNLEVIDHAEESYKQILDSLLGFAEQIQYLPLAKPKRSPRLTRSRSVSKRREVSG